MVWLFDRTEKLADALQANILRQGLVSTIAAAYLLSPQLRKSVASVLNLSDPTSDNRSLLFEAAIPLILIFLFISLGYYLALYLAGREAFHREFLNSDWFKFDRLPYENPSLAFLIAVGFRKREQYWETFIGGDPPQPRSWIVSRLSGVPYQLLVLLLLVIWISNHVIVGYFVADRFSSELHRLVAYSICMVSLIPFYLQFLTTGRFHVGATPCRLGAAILLVALVSGLIVIASEPCPMLRLYAPGSEQCS